MAARSAPLNATFMIAAILGFLISVVYIRKYDVTWAFAFALVFVLMIIASLIAMVNAPVKGQLMPQLEEGEKTHTRIITRSEMKKASAPKKKAAKSSKKHAKAAKPKLKKSKKKSGRK